ncbi:MAG: hypothetical protein QXR13_02595, partial [Candidatus Bathyarchaeia archaeon]
MMKVSALKLKLSMLATLVAIIGLSTLFLAVILSLLGASLIVIGAFVVTVNILQWLIAPYVIDAIYKTRKLSRSEAPELY